ncbi:hypothetical protein BJX64DRAFT_291079 [Aspergillus heterothallicus]
MDKNKKFEWQKMLQLPWTMWCILAFSLFQTSAALVFSQHATELAEQRFAVDSVKAGWYSALSQDAGFFLVPCLGVFIDVLGNRATVLFLCGLGTFLAMEIVNFAPSTGGTAGSFAVFAIASSLGPASIIDSIRTTLWHQSVFGSAYALKITMNNAMNIIIRIITGALQDADDNSYRRAVQVYLFQGAAGLAIGLAIFVGSLCLPKLELLQWTRWKRLNQGPEIIQELKERNLERNPRRTRRIAISRFACIMALTVGGWVAYIWGAVTGHNQ